MNDHIYQLLLPDDLALGAVCDLIVEELLYVLFVLRNGSKVRALFKIATPKTCRMHCIIPFRSIAQTRLS